MMTSRLDSLCFDANDPTGLASFWSEALDWKIEGGTDDVIGIVPIDNSEFAILFLPVPGEKVIRNPIHLDLTSASLDDQKNTVKTLIELGAHHIDIGQRPDERHVVLADPEGNEFCVIEPGNSFVDQAGKLGSLTCDGSREVGYFWSEVLGWPLVWDQDGETAIRAPDGTGPFITWGPPVPPNSTKNRLHLDISPEHGDQRTEVDRLVSLGARQIDIGQGEVDWVVMADPDGNEFCVLQRR
jgi:catechol 2,3-dioxygenase-like lactoylglutathione lyase family enzyme